MQKKQGRPGGVIVGLPEAARPTPPRRRDSCERTISPHEQLALIARRFAALPRELAKVSRQGLMHQATPHERHPLLGRPFERHAVFIRPGQLLYLPGGIKICPSMNGSKHRSRSLVTGHTAHPTEGAAINQALVAWCDGDLTAHTQDLAHCLGNALTVGAGVQPASDAEQTHPLAGHTFALRRQTLTVGHGKAVFEPSIFGAMQSHQIGMKNVCKFYGRGQFNRHHIASPSRCPSARCLSDGGPYPAGLHFDRFSHQRIDQEERRRSRLAYLCELFQALVRCVGSSRPRCQLRIRWHLLPQTQLRRANWGTLPAFPAWASSSSHPHSPPPSAPSSPP